MWQTHHMILACRLMMSKTMCHHLITLAYQRLISSCVSFLIPEIIERKVTWCLNKRITDTSACSPQFTYFRRLFLSAFSNLTVRRVTTCRIIYIIRFQTIKFFLTMQSWKYLYFVRVCVCPHLFLYYFFVFIIIINSTHSKY